MARPHRAPAHRPGRSECGSVGCPPAVHMASEPDQHSLRVCDADRRTTAERLQVAHDEGRLSLVEYDERVQQAYAAVSAPVWSGSPPTCRSRVATCPVSGGNARPPSAGRPAPTTVLLVGIWGLVLLSRVFERPRTDGHGDASSGEGRPGTQAR